MNQARENFRFSATIFAIAGIVAWGCALLLTGVLKLGDLAAGSRFLGLAALATSLLAYALNRRLWRKWPLKLLLRIPDISGRWEGWTYRSLTGEWRPSAEEFTQHALDIAANAWGPDNWSRGLCASIVHGGGAWQLIWSYKTEPTTPSYEAGDQHSGAHFLRLAERDGRRFLEGMYVNDRVRRDGTMGAGGFVRLVWVSATLKTSLAYNEGSWPIPKPNAPPPS